MCVFECKGTKKIADVQINFQNSSAFAEEKHASWNEGYPLNNFYDSERIPLICVHESAPQVDALSEDVGKEYAIFSKRRSKKD